MRRPMRMMVLAGVLAVGSGLGLGGSSARAHEPATGGGQGGGGYSGGGYSGGGFGGGYGVPNSRYYGNGGHDFQPHWHTTRTPFGSFQWFGNGRHDSRPHEHSQTPYGIKSYNGGRFSDTRSYSPPTPYTYRPW